MQYKSRTQNTDTRAEGGGREEEASGGEQCQFTFKKTTTQANSSPLAC